MGAVLLLGVAAVPRLAALDRQPLWADELFSLALVTGHSLEHPASEADPTRGDFVEVRGPVPGETYHRYLRHDDPPAGVARVIRAVFLSDTNPPLYYVLASGWTRLAGTSDAAIRLFSVFWALASLPLLWAVGRRMGGRRAAVAACVLYVFAPMSLYYSIEARMYSLMWFLALLLVYQSLRLHQRGARPGCLLLWSGTAAAGLLTHYFFVFALAAVLVWLLIYPGRVGRLPLAGAVVLAGLSVLPWYVHIPESLTRWRVTAGWLERRLTSEQMLRGTLDLLWSHFAGGGEWGGSNRRDWLLSTSLALIGLVGVLRGWVPSLFTRRRQLLWLWLVASPLGLVLFDLLRGTFTVLIPRYALAGLPATVLLAGVLIGRFRPLLWVGLLALIIFGWSHAIRVVLRDSSRVEPYRQLAVLLAQWLEPSDLVIVHSNPSGVLGVARYADPKTQIVGWVGQLGQRRVRDDLCELLAGRASVVLVKIHTARDERERPEDWLRAHARRVDERTLRWLSVSHFVLGDGGQASGLPRICTGQSISSLDLWCPVPRLQAGAGQRPSAGTAGFRALRQAPIRSSQAQEHDGPAGRLDTLDDVRLEVCDQGRVAIGPGVESRRR